MDGRENKNKPKTRISYLIQHDQYTILSQGNADSAEITPQSKLKFETSETDGMKRNREDEDEERKELKGGSREEKQKRI